MGKAAKLKRAAAAAEKALAVAEKAAQKKAEKAAAKAAAEAAKQEAAEQAAEQASEKAAQKTHTVAQPTSSTSPPPPPPPPKKPSPSVKPSAPRAGPRTSLPDNFVRLSRRPLQRYAFFTPSSPLICSLVQPGGIRSNFGSGVAQCERILGYTFKSKALLAEALKVDQTADPQAQFRLKGALYYLPYNKRLAVYGDSLLRTYLARQWLELGPVEGTGGLWGAKTNLALSDQYLGGVYRKLRLDYCISVSSEGAYNSSGGANPPSEKNPKYMATTVEAIAAAAFLDGGNPALEAAMKSFGMNKLFAKSPVIYDFFRHGQPEGIATTPPPPSVPSVDFGHDVKTPSAK
ncbi:uncharacterized protein PG986_013884 [Apiospora aurea]|uniref:RNase III domain-containing protein n=1 Tax=Apiospora aurea TaxID=335848 RepID=A0ABR1PWW8_9PEZI